MSLPNSLALLDALSREGAFGWAPGPAEADAAIQVVIRRRNVSMGCGRFAREAGETLVAAGLADQQPSGASGRSRIVLTEKGRRHVALSKTGAIEPARALHGEMRPGVALEGRAPVTIEEAESPLAWLARRRGKDGRPLIDPVAFEAGERLRRDMTLAQTLPSVTSRWDGMPGQSGAGPSPGHVSDLVLAASQRVSHALEGVGPEFSGLLVDVCGFLKGLERIEAERNWPRRTARIVLALALSKLARHYGLSSAARGPAHAAIRHWGGADYRPHIGP